VSDLPQIRIADLCRRYEGVLFDAFGTLIDGAAALPGAPELTARLTREGTRWFILTNDASRSAANAASRYRGLGLSVSAEQVITSGSLVAPFFAERGLRGARTLVLGPDDARAAARDAGAVLVPADGAPLDVLVVADEAGYPMPDALDAAITAVFRTVERGRAPVLLLPNPDLIFPKGGGAFGIAAGSLALVVEAALAARFPERRDLRFERLGKPHRPIFEEAFRRAGTRAVVLVGDSLETDVRGAREAGIDSAFIATGVSRVPAAPDPLPTWLLASLDF
jgi:HAD superfamily hydrolase (TIGR01450 family)